MATASVPVMGRALLLMVLLTARLVLAQVDCLVTSWGAWPRHDRYGGASRPAAPAPRLQTQAHTPRYRSHESPTTAPALTVAQRHRKAPRSAVQPTAGDRAVVLLGWPCIAQQKQPQGLSSGQVEMSEFERRLACQKARCSRAEQWVSYSCTGVQPFGVAPRGTSQTCRPGGSPGRSYGVILQLRRGVAPCEVRAAMTAR